MPGRARLLAVIALVFGLVLLVAREGAAQTAGQKSGARAAAQAGVQAYTEKRWQDALDMFERAEALVHSPVHLLYIARASAKLGKLVYARESYIAATRERVDESSPKAFLQARDRAKVELAELEPRLPYLTLKVTGAPLQNVTVTMDGEKMPPLLIGVPHPVDPGEHRFEATGAGVTPAAIAVTIAEGERKTAELAVEFDEQAAAAAQADPVQEESPAAAPAAGVESEATVGRDEAPADAGPDVLRIASYGALGLGAVGLGMGVFFGLDARSKQDEADALCNDRGCPESRRGDIEALDDNAKSSNTLAIVGFAVGGVGLAAGGTLLVLSLTGDSSETATVRPFVGPGSAGVAGRF